jgi:hypothetical protein
LRDEREIASLHPAMIDEPAQERLEFALGRWRRAQEADASHPVGVTLRTAISPAVVNSLATFASAGPENARRRTHRTLRPPGSVGR